MADGTPTDKFLSKTTRATRAPGGVRPFRPPQAFHRFDRDVYGLVEFPVKVMLYALQEVFAITDKWRYNSDDAQTNIYIADRYPQGTTGESETPALRPALITDRGPITLLNVNGRQHNRRVLSPTGVDGLVTYEDLVNCPMTIHCLAPKGPEAERLAALVMAMLVIDEQVFKHRGVHAILNPEIGTEGPLEQTVQLELVDVPVAFTMQYAWAWARRPDGGPIEKVGRLAVTAT